LVPDQVRKQVRPAVVLVNVPGPNPYRLQVHLCEPCFVLRFYGEVEGSELLDVVPLCAKKIHIRSVAGIGVWFRLVHGLNGEEASKISLFVP
jgi:hypothetical protein